jgi:hypothetical protein
LLHRRRGTICVRNLERAHENTDASAFRRNRAATLDAVVDGCEEVVITRVGTPKPLVNIR